jgi:hypothetical protein
MNKHNTIFGQILALISKSPFEKLVQEHKTEHGPKGLRRWVPFVSMLFGQILGQHGLRSIEQGMNNQYNRLYHLGIPVDSKSVKRSTWSYANTHRDSNLFKGVFELLVGEAQKIKSPQGFRFKNPLYSIDSTTKDLCGRVYGSNR